MSENNGNNNNNTSETANDNAVIKILDLISSFLLPFLSRILPC